MEIKVGDYVRNKYGIAKIINIENNNGIEVLVFDKNICFLVNKETGKIKDDKLLNRLAIIEGIDLNKIKSSSNIIDLIQVGDYINGHRVSDIYEDINGQIRIKFGENGLVLAHKSNYDNYYLFEEDIKSIVTKEQFSNMEYEIER